MDQYTRLVLNNVLLGRPESNINAHTLQEPKAVDFFYILCGFRIYDMHLDFVRPPSLG